MRATPITHIPGIGCNSECRGTVHLGEGVMSDTVDTEQKYSEHVDLIALSFNYIK